MANKEVPSETVSTIALAAVLAAHAILVGGDGPHVEAWLERLDRGSEYHTGMWRSMIEGLRSE